MSFQTWDTSTVLDKLKALKLDKYTSSFQSNDISGPVLPLLTEAHLKELGMTLVGHRLKFLKYVIMLQSGVDSLAPKQAARPSSRSSNNGSSSPRPAAQSSSPASGQSPSGSGENLGSSRKILKSEVVESPKAAKPPPKKKAAPQPSYNDDDDDDDGYNPPPPPSKKSPLRTSVRRNAPPPPPPPDGDDDRVECAYCHRRFASDRISKHEEVCARMSSKKKRVFDAAKQRLAGTDAASYARKSSKAPERPKQSKYKQEHQKLVEALRAARKYQAYEKAKEEGRAVGPPPELPKYEIEDDDRIPCPYCGRKFGADNAQRHIASCAGVNGGGGGRMRTGGPTKRYGRR